MATRIEKPWGHELLWSHTDHYAGKILHIEAGQRLSLQFHEHKHESVLVISGTLLMNLGKDDDARIVVMQEGDSMDLPAGTIHRFEAPADGPVDLIEVSTPHLDDVIRLQDDYDRA